MRDIILTNYDIEDGIYNFVPSNNTESDVKKIGLNSSLIVFELWNEQCTKCPAQEQILEDVKEKSKDSIQIFKLNIGYDGNLAFAQNFPLQQLPSLIFLNPITNNPYFFNGITKKDVINYFIENYKDSDLCIGCPQSNPLRVKRDNKYYCSKLDEFPYFKEPICEEIKPEEEKEEESIEELMAQTEEIAKEELAEETSITESITELWNNLNIYQKFAIPTIPIIIIVLIIVILGISTL